MKKVKLLASFLSLTLGVTLMSCITVYGALEKDVSMEQQKEIKINDFTESEKIRESVKEYIAKTGNTVIPGSIGWAFDYTTIDEDAMKQAEEYADSIKDKLLTEKMRTNAINRKYKELTMYNEEIGYLAQEKRILTSIGLDENANTADANTNGTILCDLTIEQINKAVELEQVVSIAVPIYILYPDMTTGPAHTNVHTTTTESESYEKLTGIPDKIIYKKGEKLELSGIKTTDGKDAVISPTEVIVTYLWNEKHTIEEFSSLKAGKYSVSVRNISFNVYIDDPDDENMYFQLENATVTVIEADNSIGPEYAKFSGLNETFRYDADAGMSSEWNWVDIKTGDTVSGVLWTSLSVNNRAYIYKGDLTLIGRLGDANCDYELNMADAVLIMQSIANPEKYGTDGTNENHISEQGKKNADITGDNDGVTNADALAIQKKLLKLD